MQKTVPLGHWLQEFWESQEPSLLELMDSCFISIKQKSLAASRTLLQQLLACLNFTLDSERLFFWYKQKSDFYELWQQHKQMKTMEMSNAWPDSYIEGYIYIYISEPTHKIH